MKHLLLTCALLAALPAAALAQPGPAINGIRSNPRVFNDFSTTTLAIVNGNNVNGGAVSVTETNWTNDNMGGNFANRHDFLLSTDAGVSPWVFSIDDSFSFETTVTLTPASTSPRKEVGIRMNSPVTGDALFIVNSDAGEIVAFGGGAPFKSFSAGPPAQPYVPGTPITLGIRMIANGDGNGSGKNQLEYYIKRTPASAVESSGLLPWDNLEGGPVNFTVGTYTQSAPNLSNPSESVTTNFANIRYAAIPEPGTLAMAALALVGLAARRRR